MIKEQLMLNYTQCILTCFAVVSKLAIKTYLFHKEKNIVYHVAKKYPEPNDFEMPPLKQKTG